MSATESDGSWDLGGLQAIFGVCLVYQIYVVVGLNAEETMIERPLEITAGVSVDLSRLERGIALQVRPVGRGRFRVSGGRETHWVDLVSHNQPRCDCGDHLWREALCKHILAALLRQGDERVLEGVRTLVSELREGRRAA